MNIKYYIKKTLSKIINFQNTKNTQFGDFLIIKGERKNWVLNQIAKEYKNLFLNLFHNVSHTENKAYMSDEIRLFIMSKYYALKNLNSFKNKLYFPYFHGISDIQSSKDNISIIKKNINKISKIQVSNSLIENFLLENNIPPERFKKIPITVDINKFSQIDNLNQKEAREYFKIPSTAFVVGSFQKDGDGWGSGKNPKLIKGPDIFIKTLDILKTKIPELFVILSGPSRGYVINELKKKNIKFKYFYFESYEEVIKLYKSLNVYLISSREEGGPRAIMESFASKIPLVTTNVGMAVDLIKNDFNAFKSKEINDEELANTIYLNIYNNNENLKQIIENGYQTVRSNSYDKQINLWKNFFN
mgnify:CR=1 FL=1|tara:strand:- start:3130 stop:4206 length:1077 start_codon:yes stop_codon:yes gene_type:complete